MSKSKEAHDLGINARKGNPGNDHWQVDVSKSVFPRGEGDDPTGRILAKTRER